MILYVCKHNVFRSRIAEEYAKQRGLDADSAGLIPCGTILPEELPVQARVAKEFGIDLYFKPKPVTLEMLTKVSKLVIVAKDVPKEIFNNPAYQLDGKIEHWMLPDVRSGSLEEDSRRIIEQIIKQVDLSIK